MCTYYLCVDVRVWERPCDCVYAYVSLRMHVLEECVSVCVVCACVCLGTSVLCVRGGVVVNARVCERVSRVCIYIDDVRSSMRVRVRVCVNGWDCVYAHVSLRKCMCM